MNFESSFVSVFYIQNQKAEEPATGFNVIRRFIDSQKRVDTGYLFIGIVIESTNG